VLCLWSLSFHLSSLFLSQPQSSIGEFADCNAM
jgi:hypothetical protein